MRPLQTAVMLLGVTAGCVPLRPEHVPLPTVAYPGPHPTELVLMLPGRGDDMGEFARRGFVDDARTAGSRADFVAADAHLAYYLHEQVVTRLWQDVVEPARARGVARVSVVGISLGGLGALLLARAHPGVVDTVVLLAPYLGPNDVPKEIEAAGGLARWAPGPDRHDFRGVWAWLQGPQPKPRIFLGYGESDRFGRGHRALAAALPPDHVLQERGGHDWPTWRRLWRRVLPLALAPGRPS